MNNRTLEEQLSLLNRNGVPEAGALLESLKKIANERGFNSLLLLLSQFDIKEERRNERHNEEVSRPMTRLEILQYYRNNGIWPKVRRLARTNRHHHCSRSNMRKVREVRRFVGDYIYQDLSRQKQPRTRPVRGGVSFSFPSFSL